MTPLRNTIRWLLLFALICGYIGCKRAEVIAPAATPLPAPPNLRFIAYEGSPTAPLKDMTFQVSGPDGHSSEFLKVGDIVPSTRFKLTAFQYKTRHNPQTGENEDASELTLENVETRQVVVLTYAKAQHSPPVF